MTIKITYKTAEVHSSHSLCKYWQAMVCNQEAGYQNLLYYTASCLAVSFTILLCLEESGIQQHLLFPLHNKAIF